MRFVEGYIPDSCRKTVDAFKDAVLGLCGDMGLALTVLELRSDGDQGVVAFTLSDSFGGRTCTVKCAMNESPTTVGKRVRREAIRLIHGSTRPAAPKTAVALPSPIVPKHQQP
jgi:hypothetical protein